MYLWSFTREIVGLHISQRGIEVDPVKAKAIIQMSAPHTKKEVHSFLGHIQYISRFIVQLIPICEPIFKLLRKNTPVEWNGDC